MNLKNLAKEVGASYYKKGDSLIKKNAVRELEEQQKDKFIAFVDDGPDSFDVMIMLDKKFEVIEHSCDCTEKYIFCEHKVAVALHLKDRGKSEVNSIAKKIRTKKIDELRQFIDAIEEQALKDWVYNLVKSNKEVNHIMMTNFEKKTIELDIKIITDRSQAMFKAILGKAKYYDASQLTKIISLWQPYHFDIIDEVMIDPTNEVRWNCMQHLLFTISDYKILARKSTNKLDKYEQTLFEKISLKTHDLDIDKRNNFIAQLAESYLKNIFQKNVYLIPILAHLSSIEQVVRHRILNDIIAKLNANGLSKVLFDLLNTLDESENLKEYIHLFKIIFAEPEYNLKLIHKLIQYGYSYEAEKMCLQCIKDNRNIDYNEVYHEVLMDIYMENGDEVAYYDQLKFIIPLSLNYAQYKSYMDYEQDINIRKVFENKIERQLSAKFGQLVYGAFMMQLLAEKKDYSNMLSHISASYPVAYYYDYIEELYNYDKELLLEKLLYMKYANYTYRSFEKQDIELWNTILDKYYGKKKVQDKVNKTKAFTLLDVYIKAYLAD